MHRNMEYIKLFMEYIKDNLPVVYFYEVDLDNERLSLRDIDVFADRTVKTDDDPYRDVIEIVPIPTVEELNNGIWGEGFYASLITQKEFDEIWESEIYKGDLSAD